ncbi:MAG: hypothetical protein ACLP59_18055 [Bryobacteraceae bacterium]
MKTNSQPPVRTANGQPAVHCVAVVDPLDTRQILTMALELTLHRPRGEQLILETL